MTYICLSNSFVDIYQSRITDSINYAKRIQTAILPSKAQFCQYLPKSFIFYKPKDIVSGDLFWVEEINSQTYYTDGIPDKIVLFAAVDCTGHGVPGAFMSIVAHNLLNQALKEENITQCSDILSFISQGINKMLRKQKEEDSVKDGMDISLCALNRNKMLLEFAGVHNSIYHVRKNLLTEYKPDHQPIGDPLPTEDFCYTNHFIALEDGDCIYLYSDGYVDQFGGPNRKKFLSRNLKEIISANQHLSMEEQKTHLSTHFDEWKSDIPQYDDVLVMGVKI